MDAKYLKTKRSNLNSENKVGKSQYIVRNFKLKEMKYKSISILGFQLIG